MAIYRLAGRGTAARPALLAALPSDAETRRYSFGTGTARRTSPWTMVVSSGISARNCWELESEPRRHGA